MERKAMMQRFRLFLGVLLFLTNLMSMAQPSVWNGGRELWVDGTGTESNPYLIASAENLAFLSYMVNKGYETQGLYFRLTTDIDLNGSEDQSWEPIGLGDRLVNEDGCDRGSFEAGTSFRGHFDGGGHGISNIYVDERYTYAGLFGMVCGRDETLAIIENVSVVSGSVNGFCSGGVVGNGCYLRLSECGNGAAVSGTIAGGIMGMTKDAMITNCYNSGTVCGLGVNLADSPVAGGVLGATQNLVGMSNSYNVGEIACTNHKGCLVGYLMDGSVNVDNCHYLDICDQNNYGTPQSAVFMRTMDFVFLLNGQNTELVWAFDVNNDNNGYPILAEEVFSVEMEASPMEGGSTSGGGLYASGTTCTVSAMANNRFVFVNWTENEDPVSNESVYSFPITSNRNLAANFTLESYEITTSSNPLDAGVVIGDGIYNFGETVTLVAIPSDSYTFHHWIENDVVLSDAETYSFTADHSCHIVANFGFCEFVNETASCIEVFPNPAHDFLFIKGLGVHAVTVFNVMGQMVDHFEMEGREMMQISLKEYAVGTFIVKICLESHNTFVKVMKQ